jgi:hypothetical protein
MATYTGQLISSTYKSIIKTSDSLQLTGEVELTDGLGTASGLFINIDGTIKGGGNVDFSGNALIGGNITSNGFVSAQSYGSFVGNLTSGTLNTLPAATAPITDAGVFGTGNKILSTNNVSPLTAFVSGFENELTGDYSSVAGYKSKNYADKSAVLAADQTSLLSGNSSIASGFNNSVKGSYSAFFGSTNAVTGSASTSIISGGSNNISSLRYGIVGGQGNTVAGARNLAVGGFNNLGGSDGIVFGSSNTNGGQGSIVGGFRNDNASSYSLVMGQSNVNRAKRSSVIGNNNVSTSGTGNYIFGDSNTIGITGYNAFIIGGTCKIEGETTNCLNVGYQNRITTGKFSQLIGSNLENTAGVQSLVVGKFNKPQFGDTVFAVGVGEDDNNRLNAVEITQKTSLTISNIIIAQILNHNFNSESAAAAGGVELGGIYRNGNDLKIRTT